MRRRSFLSAADAIGTFTPEGFWRLLKFLTECRLDYVVFAVLIFLHFNDHRLVRFARNAPTPMPHCAGYTYPIVPAIYIVAATVISLAYLQTETSLPGLAIVLSYSWFI